MKAKTFEAEEVEKRMNKAKSLFMTHPTDAWETSALYKNHTKYHERIVRMPILSCPMCLELESERYKALASQRIALIEEIAEKMKRYDCNHKKHIWVPACRMVRVCKYCGLVEGVWATVQEMRAALAERKETK